jgi:hypothetical protein
MDHLTLTDRMVVKATGPRGGSGPLTLGQLNVAQWVGPGEHCFEAIIDCVLHLPRAATLTGVLDALAELVARHESLRTRFEFEPELRQHVSRTGELPVDIYEFDPDVYPDSAAFSGEGDPRTVPFLDTPLEGALKTRLRAVPFNTTDDILVRAAVAVHDDVPVAVVVAFSHLVVDLAAAILLDREFGVLAGDPAGRIAAPPARQPLDQAAVEREPRHRRRAEAALRFWGTSLRRMPQAILSLPVTEPPIPPVAGRLYSWVLPQALASIQARTRADSSMAIMAALAAVLALRTDTPRFWFPLIAHHRYGADLHEHIGTLAQDVPIVVDTEVPSFDDLVRQCATATMRSCMQGPCDMAEYVTLRERIERERGTRTHRDLAFNNIGKHRLAEEVLSMFGEPVLPANTPRTTTAEWLAALDSSPGRLVWATQPYHEDMLSQFQIAEFDLMTGIGMYAWDTGRVPKTEIESLLRAAERLLVVAAAGDVALSELGELTGLTPFPREPGRWLRLDSCWVEPAEVRRLLDDALTPACLDVRHDDDRALVAYLAAGGRARTPEEAHTACLEKLAGRPTAMAPRWYVVCDGAPDDPSDLAAWQRRPVLAEGDGR